MNIQYRLWQDGALWHYEVLTERGSRLRHGAATEMWAARAEAMAAFNNPAIAMEIDALEESRAALRSDRAGQALLDAERRYELISRRLPHFQLRREVTDVLARRSRDALDQARQMLRSIELDVPSRDLRGGGGIGRRNERP